MFKETEKTSDYKESVQFLFCFWKSLSLAGIVPVFNKTNWCKICILSALHENV